MATIFLAAPSSIQRVVISFRMILRNGTQKIFMNSKIAFLIDIAYLYLNQILLTAYVLN